MLPWEAFSRSTSSVGTCPRPGNLHHRDLWVRDRCVHAAIAHRHQRQHGLWSDGGSPHDAGVTSATLQSIAVSPANPSIAAGTDRQFSATGTYSDASTADLTGSVTWSSATTSVATIGGTGLAHGVAAGTSTIGATLGAVSGSTVLTVTSATLQSIAVTPADPSIAAGTDRQFSATGTYSDASTADLTGSVTWSSATSLVATIHGRPGPRRGRGHHHHRRHPRQRQRHPPR